MGKKGAGAQLKYTHLGYSAGNDQWQPASDSELRETARETVEAYEAAKKATTATPLQLTRKKIQVPVASILLHSVGGGGVVSLLLWMQPLSLIQSPFLILSPLPLAHFLLNLC